jgi:hypothetical protein
VEQIGGDKVENIADVDKVLLAIGRSPNTEELNLPAVVSTRGVCYLWHFFLFLLKYGSEFAICLANLDTEPCMHI